jgi:hypothetical protein
MHSIIHTIIELIQQSNPQQSLFVELMHAATVRIIVFCMEAIVSGIKASSLKSIHYGYAQVSLTIGESAVATPA